MLEQIFKKHSAITIVVLVLTVIFCSQIAGSYTLSIDEAKLGIPGLQQVPDQIGSWNLAEDQPLEPDVANYLRPDDYIQRAYISRSPDSSISLFVAYFKSLQNNYGPHSPQACLPGSGWLVHLWQVIDMPVPGKPETVPINEYVLEKGGQRILVLYWYQNGRRVWAEEFQVKLHLLPDLLRYHRSDISLVRVVATLSPDTPLDAALRPTMKFSQTLYPILVERFTHTG
ncbi:MAG TPA: EpsI family protein [Bryobacteraceae bacterium]|nr:EpsI family protein [Bryobacteraceae bacterium]